MVVIRQAREAESSDISRFIISIMKSEGPYSPTWPARDIDNPVAAYANQNGAFLVAEENGKIIGTVGIHKVNDIFVILRRFYVAAEFRGKGIGKALLEHAFKLCKEKKYSALITISEEERKRAFKIYLEAGFSVFKSGAEVNFFVKYLLPTAPAIYPPEKLARMNWVMDWDGTRWKPRS